MTKKSSYRILPGWLTRIKSLKKIYAGFIDSAAFLSSVCKKTQSALRKCQDQGARSPKKGNVHGVHEHFWDEWNEDIDVFLEALSNEINTHLENVV